MQKEFMYTNSKGTGVLKKPIALSATAVNMIAVILFYVIVFVAVNVFSGQI